MEVMAKNEYFKRTSKKVGEESIKDLAGHKYKVPYTHFSIKLDGTHAELHIGDEVQFITRDGNNVAHLVPYLVDSIKNLPNWQSYAGVYACELVHLDKVLHDPKDCWSASRRVLGCKHYNEEQPEIQCVIYDVHDKIFNPHVKDFHYFHRRLQLPKPDYLKDNEYARYVVPCLNLPNIYVPVLHDADTSIDMWEEFIVNNKNEGFCYVDLNQDNVYKWEHTFCKAKPCIDIDAVVMGYHEGKAGTKLEGKLGAFEIGLYKDGVLTSIGKCPTMTDKERSKWTDRMQSPDDEVYVVQVRAGEVTSKNKLRFPSYVRERTDKMPLECDWEQLS